MLLRELKSTLLLALPLMAGQVGQMVMGMTDTIMLGRLGPTELAASSFANILVWIPMVFGIGLMVAVSMRVSQARGSNSPDIAAESLRHGLWLGLVAGAALAAGLLALLPWLGHFGQSPEVAAAAPVFYLPVALSVLPALMTMALKNYADAMEQPWVCFWINLGGILLNVLLNWLLIFGKLGCPALGLAGAGWATCAARTATLIALFAWVATAPAFRGWRPLRWAIVPRWAVMTRLLALGTPVSLGLLTEVAAFGTAGLMAGWLGTASLAAHQIALSCASFTFMVPLGLSMATTVRVGACHGAEERARLRAIAIGSLAAGAGLMTLSAAGFLCFGPIIAGWFVSDPGVQSLAARLLVIAGLFQIFDGLQITASGVLRGLNDVRVPALLSFVAYWVLALPLAWVAAFVLGWNAEGIWAGLALGLGAVACALVIRVRRSVGRPRAVTNGPP
jgi:MATE family multidrug resistance protein